MSKEFSFYLGKSLASELRKPIRSQLDLVKLSLKTAEQIITPNSGTKEVEDKNCEGFRIVYPNLANEKSQRIFFLNSYPDYQEKEMYTIQSFVFPFKLEKTESEEIKIWYSLPSNRIEMNAATISQITTLINIIDSQETWGDTWVEELLDLLYGRNRDIETQEIFYIVNEFLTFDFGYLRFDNDPKYEKENHPRYHIDVHMNNKATYKLGFHEAVNMKEFIELLDNNSLVRFIEKPN